MDDSLIRYIEKRLLQDIKNAKAFYEVRRVEEDQIDLIIDQLQLAWATNGEPRKTHLRTARVLLAMIAPRD